MAPIGIDDRFGRPTRLPYEPIRVRRAACWGTCSLALPASVGNTSDFHDPDSLPDAQELSDRKLSNTLFDPGFAA